MSRYRITILAALIISLVAIGGLLYCDRITAGMKEKPTLMISPEEMDTLQHVRFCLPKDENPTLTSDLLSTVFNEDELMQYLIVPKDFPAFGVVCYAVDDQDNLLNRYVIDFSETGEFAVGLRHLYLKQTSLPVMTIEIGQDSESFEKMISSEKGIECTGDFALYVDKEQAHKKHWIEEVHSRDVSRDTLGSVTIRGRGNSTWDFADKKSFTLVFEKAVYMLGLGKHKKWNLISNSQDQTLLNNEVFLKMAADMGVAFEPKCEQVTLYVDGNYQGVYLLTTKVNVDKDRVDLRGGDFFINWGGTGAAQPLFYESETWLDDGSDYQDPFVDLIWPEEASDAEKSLVASTVQAFISSIEDPADPSYTDHMDLDSMVRYYWAQEICMNYDAAFRSTYSYYKADTGKIYMGPVWDLDLCLGWNADKCGADFTDPAGWKLRGMSWYVPLFARKDFVDAIRDAYWNGGVREAMFDALARYEQRVTEMHEDGQLNYRRWNGDRPDLGIFYGEDYASQAAGRLQFFKDRVSWIDAEMSKGR